MYGDHGKILPMEIGESVQKMKQEWSILYLDSMVDLFEKIEEGVEFAEAKITPNTRGKSIQY